MCDASGPGDAGLYASLCREYGAASSPRLSFLEVRAFCNHALSLSHDPPRDAVSALERLVERAAHPEQAAAFNVSIVCHALLDALVESSAPSTAAGADERAAPGPACGPQGVATAASSAPPFHADARAAAASAFASLASWLASGGAFASGRAGFDPRVLLKLAQAFSLKGADMAGVACPPWANCEAAVTAFVDQLWEKRCAIFVCPPLPPSPRAWRQPVLPRRLRGMPFLPLSHFIPVK